MLQSFERGLTWLRLAHLLYLNDNLCLPGRFVRGRRSADKGPWLKVTEASTYTQPISPPKMTNPEQGQSQISKYAWAVIVAAIVLSVVLLIVGLHSYRTKRAARLKRQRDAENDKIFGGVMAKPLIDGPALPNKPPTRPQRGRSLVYSGPQ
ncbi:uncharacterized protein AB675_6032 [Cyphellophora attinorum]|uniref:Uncharacterized protein n=1 Tax=Cyphellophora attinorum TaxID=1664694 RepID=A0A0N0NJJ9_9EURO|nr:uncharacterized protein AB675_6032 [Phialophora attinorum]KPI36988.1 hypothetical protein AB675_6032 [Phialophora attinorum]